MPLEKSKSDTTEVSNLMFDLNVTMQGIKTDLVLIAALMEISWLCYNGLSLKNCVHDLQIKMHISILKLWAGHALKLPMPCR